MDVLLIATGFTGALTLVWLYRLLTQLFRTPMSVSTCFAPRGSLDVLLREVAAARSSIQLMAGQLACPSLAEALHQALSRRVRVEILLDASCETETTSDLAFLIEVGLTPQVTSGSTLHHQCLIVDGRTALLASFPLTSQADIDQSGSLLVVRGHPELVRSLMEEFALQRETARPAEVRPLMSSRPNYSTRPVEFPAPPVQRPESQAPQAVVVQESVSEPAGETEPQPSSSPMPTVRPPAPSDVLRELTARLARPGPDGADIPDEEEVDQEEEEPAVGYVDPPAPVISRAAAEPVSEQPAEMPSATPAGKSLLDRPFKEPTASREAVPPTATPVAPMVTPAAAELIARLRKQLAIGKESHEDEQMAV